MPNLLHTSDTPGTPPPEPKKKGLGCLAQVLIAGAFLLVGLGTIMWLFADRTRRANSFGNYIKEGYTVRQVFAGPREWDFLWAHCGANDEEQSVHVVRQDGGCLARCRGEEISYPNFDAVVEAMATGQGPFQGLRSIHLVYKFYIPSRTYNLLLGPEGKVVKIERISRS